MDEILIPKDFKKYTPKVLGGMTMRQIVLLVPAGVLAVLLNKYMSGNFYVLLIVIIFGLVWAFGWTKPYNMKFEDFITTSFVKMFLSPQKRIYKTKNLHRTVLEKEEGKKKNEKEK